VEVVLPIHQELQVVETCAELAKALPGVLLMTHKAQNNWLFGSTRAM
jgi:hypothetical protein